MNKILIVGHPQSGYLEVERVLHACGMQSAMLSKNEGFSPYDISAALRKAHGIPLVHELDSEEQAQQIDAGPVWNGLALDLLLGNVEQKLWGWSDPQALCLLEYWKNLDPKMTFVLVYDEPHRVLAETVCDESMCLTEAAVLQLLDNWNVYSGALLWFYLRNKSRCMLVNAQQVRNNAESCLKELQSYLNVPLALPEHYSGNGFSRNDNVRNDARSDMKVQSPLVHSKAIETPALSDRYLIDRILETHPEHLQRYDELQSVASVPLDAHLRSYPDPLDALLSQMKMRSESSRILTILADDKQKMEMQLIEYELQKQRIIEELASKSSSQKELTEENELLLTQLHQVQEELERYYIENQRLKPQLNPAYYGAADRLKSELPYQLGAAMIEQSRKIWPALFLPLSLFRIAHQYRKHKKKSGEQLPSLEKYRDYHEAEKARKHLSYRLGETWLKHSHTPWGWVVMPFALSRTRQAYRQYRESIGK